MDKKKYDRQLIKWVKDHYWDSLEKDKDLLLRHLRAFVGDEIIYRGSAEQIPSANTGSADGSLSGERDVLNFGWLKTKYIKKALFAMIKNERRHVDLCRRTYKTEYMYELDDRLSDLTTIENMVGEI